ncbi:MAG: hypothetical protein OHK005_12870 [Candidatus Methylacidiphilales bacterium]
MNAIALNPGLSPLNRLELIGLSALHLGHDLANQVTILAALTNNLRTNIAHQNGTTESALRDLDNAVQSLTSLIDQIDQARRLLPSEPAGASLRTVASALSEAATLAGWETSLASLPEEWIHHDHILLARCVRSLTETSHTTGFCKLEFLKPSNSWLPGLQTTFRPSTEQGHRLMSRTAQILGPYLKHLGCRLEDSGPQEMTLFIPCQISLRNSS